MIFDNNDCYEFGDFSLFPKSRVLTYLNKTINLNGKDFDILVYLIQNPGVLVTDRDLFGAVWGHGLKIGDGNITNHISKIRKALNCEPRSPKFIQTYYGKHAYRFIAKVTHSQKNHGDVSESSTKTSDFTIESHLIAPLFLGQAAYDNIRDPARETTWAKYKEFKIDNGRLCIFPTGIGVWHLIGKHQFSSFSDVASWRRETYERMLNGKHTIQIYNQELRAPLISRSTNIFGSVLGKIGYIFSVMVLREPNWARGGKLRRPLQLLSYLSPIENSEAANNSADPASLEKKLLDGAYPDVETKEFGSPGQDLGFASWDGLSYLEHPDDKSTIKDDIIEFEIAVQSTWWLAKCLYDICLANGAKVKKDLALPIQDMKWQFAKLRGIVATESTAKRTMIEATLTTSRLQQLVEDTIKICDQL